MVVCQYCGNETTRPDAAYCSYCGSSLRQQPQQVTVNPNPMSSATTQGYGMSGSMTTPSTNVSERFEKAIARVELLGTVVIILAIVVLVLVFA